MAIGDKAAAKGLHVVAPTDGVPVGYTDINRVADAVADEIDARSGLIIAQNATPAGTAWADKQIWIKTA